jgi:hypothetical protein
MISTLGEVPESPDTVGTNRTCNPKSVVAAVSESSPFFFDPNRRDFRGYVNVISRSITVLEIAYHIRARNGDI